MVDESIGLPSALLHAGFGGVVASMWPVDDVVAFLTLVRLLQERSSAQSTSAAMRNVRRWLRSVTTDELRAWFYDFSDAVGLPYELIWRFAQWLSESAGDAIPLSDPADWAAFAYLGR